MPDGNGGRGPGVELLVLPSAVLLQAATLPAGAELLYDLRPLLPEAAALHEAKLLHYLRPLLRQADAAMPWTGAMCLRVLRGEVTTASN